ncbi:hypothetical protein [Streptomyces sp. AC512_CC834]|uniref:hypothetical protein n=1 Tax=Streptomyces sp. AC512_CC834 TaxID=2823691 RepID=UPI001C279DC2|nr:hypothetical protein [Streptomyces sp. AC512_CC834]
MTLIEPGMPFESVGVGPTNGTGGRSSDGSPKVDGMRSGRVWQDGSFLLGDGQE